MTAITEQLTTALGDRYLIERELGQGGMARVILNRVLNPVNFNYDIHPNGTEFLVIHHQVDSRVLMSWILNWPEILRAMGAAK